MRVRSRALHFFSILFFYFLPSFLLRFCHCVAKNAFWIYMIFVTKSSPMTTKNCNSSCPALHSCEDKKRFRFRYPTDDAAPQSQAFFVALKEPARKTRGFRGFVPRYTWCFLVFCKRQMLSFYSLFVPKGKF